MKKLTIVLAAVMSLSACGVESKSQTKKDSQAVSRQQEQYAAAQPVPAFDWSLERDLVIQLYNIRNQKAATHSVWRGDTSVVEGDCPSLGFSIPFDTSLTNPLVSTSRSVDSKFIKEALTSIEQAEPNGVFASKNTSATWVMCLGETGMLDPIYVESKVSVYPYPVSVNYSTNRVTKAGASTVTLSR
jgi:hypothetical protein